MKHVTLLSTARKLEFCEARTGLYGASARNLLKLLKSTDPDGLQVTDKPRICEVGCRTGISTREILHEYPYAGVVAREGDQEMLELAHIKFCLQECLPLVLRLLKEGDTETALSILQFARERQGVSRRVSFEETSGLDFFPDGLDLIFGSQLMHHPLMAERFEETIKTFLGALKQDGYFAVSSSMSFFKSTKFRQEETSYLYHPFVQAFFDILSDLIQKDTGVTVQRTNSPANIRDPLEVGKRIESLGFTLVKYKEVPLPNVPAAFLLDYYLRVVPAQLGMFKGTLFSNNLGAQDRFISEAIGKTVAKYFHVLPSEGILTDVNPMWVFKKQ